MIALVTVLVDDYDRAIAFYRDAVGFDLVEDTPLGDDKRWVVVAPATRPAPVSSSPRPPTNASAAG